MLFNKINRRHFLQGAGGFTLALPFLPSLMPKAYANSTKPKFFVSLMKEHGVVHLSQMYPATGPASEIDLYNNATRQHKYGIGPITNYLDSNGNFSAAIGNFMSSHWQNINILRGIDLLVNQSHQSAHLGNFHACHNLTNDDIKGFQYGPLPSIDQVMAQSPSFYPPGDPHTIKTINVSTFGRKTCSYYADGNTVSETPVLGRYVSGGNTLYETQRIFTAIFGSSTSGEGDIDPSIQRRMTLIDRVKGDYERLISLSSASGRRLGSDDRQRLQQYLDELNQLEMRLQNQSISCNAATAFPNKPNSSSTTNRTVDREFWATVFDIIVAAFRCGKSRIATLYLGDCSETHGASDFHEKIAHGAGLENAPNAAAVSALVAATRESLQYFYAPLLDRLNQDAGTGDGTTYLDNSVVMYQQESGPKAHHGFCLPTIIAGSAGGYFKTGNYVNYQETENAARWPATIPFPGIRQNRLLFTLLEAMGVPRSEYAIGPLAEMYGYGDSYVADAGSRERYGVVTYPQYALAACNQPLPGIKA